MGSESDKADASSPSEASQSAGTAASAIRNTAADFIVEFLGSLVPGSTFLLALVPGLAFPVVFLIRQLFPTWTLEFPSLSGSTPLSVTHILLLLFPSTAVFLILAYIAGQLLYRQNPKSPDAASFNRTRSEHSDGMVRPDRKRDIRVEFPYSHLKHYLADRELKYLATRIPWDPDDEFHKKTLTTHRRCKHWINALKIRIAIESPSSLRTISRNEAHVRLSSSMWYVSLALMWTSGTSIAVLIVAWVLSRAFPIIPHVSFDPVILAPAVIWLLSFLTKWAIERTLHYQREREVLFILETAYWLEMTHRVKDVFHGLEPIPLPEVSAAITERPTEEPPASNGNGDPI